MTQLDNLFTEIFSDRIQDNAREAFVRVEAADTFGLALAESENLRKLVDRLSTAMGITTGSAMKVALVFFMAGQRYGGCNDGVSIREETGNG